MPNPRFAIRTTVSEHQTRQEIEALLQRYGAEAFVYGQETAPPRALIGFRSTGRHYRFLLPLPTEEEFATDDAGRRRTSDVRRAAHAQALRSCWRALLLLIKAKLEAVERQVSSFEQEFGGYALLPSGHTVSEWLEPQLAAAYQTGRMPALLSGAVLPALPAGKAEDPSHA